MPSSFILHPDYQSRNPVPLPNAGSMVNGELMMNGEPVMIAMPNG